MPNTLKKRVGETLKPAIYEAAEQPFVPAVPTRTVTETQRICETVTSGSSGDVKTAYAPSQYVWVEYPGMPGGGRWEPPGPQVIASNGLSVESNCRNVQVSRVILGFPQQDYKPAVAYVPPSVVTDFDLGWNAGARSVAFLQGSGHFSFQVPTAVGTVVGLNDADTGTTYAEIDHGLYFARSIFRVMEAGAEKFYGGSYAPTDTFAIRRRGFDVDYLRNDVVVYASTKSSQGPVFLDASMYSGGDTIDSPALTLQAIFGSSAARLRPLAGVGSDGPYAQSSASLERLSGSAGVLVHSHAVMRPMASMSANRPYAESRPALRALSGSADATLMVPVYAVSSGQMSPLVGASSGLTGGVITSSAKLNRLTGLSSDRRYGEARGSMLAPFGYAADRAAVQPAIPLPAAMLLAFGGGTALLIAPVFELEAHGTEEAKNAFAGTAPAAQLQAFGGATAHLVSAPATLAASATLDALGQATLVAPAATLIASGTMGAIGGAVLTLSDRFTLQAFGGAVATGAMGAATLLASGTTGAVGQAALTLPLFTLQAAGTMEAFGRAELVGPALVPAPSGRAWLVAPPFRLVASGTVTVARTFETFAINLMTNEEAGIGYEVTRYTNFPFQQVVRFEDDYYGVAADGLYKLGGTTDATAPRASWALKTCQTDFGKPEFKTIVSAYLGGRFGPEAQFTIFPGEEEGVSYDFETPRGAGAQTYRQKFGRGIRQHRYYALGITGTDEVKVDTIDFEVQPLKRKI